MDLNLEQYIRPAKSGDRQAFETLICGIQEQIYELALRMLGHPEDAEDETKEILIKVITHLSDFREESAFSSWVYKIACNHFLTAQKKRYERMSLPFDLQEGSISDGIGNKEPPAIPEMDRVLTTILLTDIVGSTDHLTRLGDRKWRELLNQHDALAERFLNQFRGTLVDKTCDGILGIFNGPARAIRCATTISESVRGIGLEVRAGLHTGEVEIRGDRIAGIAVHIASRISSQAGDSEVLVSRTVKDLVAGSGIDFTDRGTHTLKGVPDEWRLFAVT